MHEESEPSNPFSNVFHDKAAKRAFFNVAAIAFAIFIGGIAVAVYYILQPFLRPMLWALLCGSFLYPFKYKLTSSSKIWLERLDSSGTPLLLGFALLPFIFIVDLTEALRNTLNKHYKFIVIASITYFVLVILLPFLWPFKGLFEVGFKLFGTIKPVLDHLNTFLISSLVLGHLIISVLFCNAKTKLFLQIFSMVLWIIVMLSAASMQGTSAMYLGVLVTILATGGSLIDTIRLKTRNLAFFNEDESSQRILNLSGLRKDSCSLQEPLVENEDVQKETFSDNCLVALVWSLVILQLWIYGVLITIVILLLICLTIQSLGYHFGIWSLLHKWFLTKAIQLKNSIVSDERFYVIIPKPVRMFCIVFLEGDKKALHFLKKSIDKICSALIIVLLLFLVGLFAVFTALEVHKESMHLVHLTGNALNSTQSSNLAQWLPEGDILKNAVDSMIKNAYVYGRESITNQLDAHLSKDEETKNHIEQQMLQIWDSLYNSWMNKDPEKSFLAKEINSQDFIQKMKKTNLDLVAIAKENVDLFMSVIKSIWSVLVSNLALTVKIITSMISVIFGGSTAIFNTLLSVVIFLTTLFYLLASSEDQYMPVKLFSSLSPGNFGPVQNVKFGKAFQDAIGSVFLVSCKMSMFYGLYTWLTHSLLGVQIVFIPSVLAAIFATVPFLGTYVVTFPAILELWLVNGQLHYALLLFVAHYLPTFIIDTAFYSEIRGGHPYLTGLAILGGIYWMGLEGAIIGPVLLCCFVIAMHMYQSMLHPDDFSN